MSLCLSQYHTDTLIILIRTPLSSALSRSNVRPGVFGVIIITVPTLSLVTLRMQFIGSKRAGGADVGKSETERRCLSSLRPQAF